MNKRNRQIIASVKHASAVSLLLMAATTTSAHEVVTHTETLGWTWTDKNTCTGGHNATKSQIKEIARTHCEEEHGSSGLNTLRNEKYTKGSCEKKKNGTRVTQVTAHGTLVWNCK